MISLYQTMGTSLFDDSCWPQHSRCIIAHSADGWLWLLCTSICHNHCTWRYI